MAEFIFYFLITFFILYFLYHLFKNTKNGKTNSGTIEKYTREKIALRNKVDTTVSIEDTDGNYHGHAKRCFNKEGIYSKAFHDDLVDLKERSGMTTQGRNKSPP